MKVSELTGAKLDYWVAKAEGYIPTMHHVGKTDRGETYVEHVSCKSPKGVMLYFSPSADWSQGGPILEKYLISVVERGKVGWTADGRGTSIYVGSTPLIAAMRCYVASKFGDTVDDSQTD